MAEPYRTRLSKFPPADCWNCWTNSLICFSGTAFLGAITSPQFCCLPTASRTATAGTAAAKPTEPPPTPPEPPPAPAISAPTITSTSSEQEHVKEQTAQRGNSQHKNDQRDDRQNLAQRKFYLAWLRTRL